MACCTSRQPMGSWEYSHTLPITCIPKGAYSDFCALDSWLDLALTSLDAVCSKTFAVTPLGRRWSGKKLDHGAAAPCSRRPSRTFIGKVWRPDGADGGICFGLAMAMHTAPDTAHTPEISYISEKQLPQHFDSRTQELQLVHWRCELKGECKALSSLRCRAGLQGFRWILFANGLGATRRMASAWRPHGVWPCPWQAQVRRHTKETLEGGRKRPGRL